MMKCLLLFILALSSAAEARVFDMSKASFAPYLRGTYTPMSMTDGLYSDSQGTGATMSNKVSYDASGEVGVLYAGKALSLRLGVEYLMLPRSNQTSSNSMYTMDSAATVLTPKIGFEINLKSWQTTKFFLLLSGGYANLASKTQYSFLPASTYGLSDFSESLKGSTVSGEAALGFEGLLSDSTTYALEAGYRYMNFSKLTYSSSGTNFKGAFASGDTAVNADGSNRTLNLSNIFVGFSFRFFLH